MKNEMIQMETAVQERLSYLQRYKDMASFKIASLQKTLDDSVPAAELELQNRFVNCFSVQLLFYFVLEVRL